MGTPAQAVYRQATGISENFAPTRNYNGICLSTVDYQIIADGNLSASPGFCPFAGQPTYQLTLTFNRPQSEYATRLVVWSNAGNIFNDSELRIFDLQVNYVDPLTLQPLVYIRTNLQIDDTLNATTPVFHNFVDASNNPIRLYGVTSVVMRNLRNIPVPNAADEAAFREVQIDTEVDASRAANIQVTKSSALFAENTQPNYAIPGNDVIYSITVSNRGNLAASTDSVFVLDLLPSQVTFFNGDANGSAAGTAVVIFQNAGSGTTLPAAALRYATTLPATFADCTYTPISGYDPAVRYICVRPSGALRGGLAAPYPAFTLQFRARVK